jgi:PAT family beta-lactamase induction signal transducer AmpG
MGLGAECVVWAGVPYVAVMMLSTVMYKNLGISNADLAFYTAWLYLPWVVKPLWSPIVEMFGTKRRWTVLMQLVGGAGLASVALTLHAPDFFRWTLVIFWLMAFSSATHDIASDGFYMLGLPTQHQQAAFVGVRSAFYKLAMIGGQGGLVYLAGELIKASGDPAHAWSVVFAMMAVLFLCCAPITSLCCRARTRTAATTGGALWQDFRHTFRSFSRNRHSCHAGLPAAVPPRRGAVAEDGRALPARSARQGRAGPEHLGFRAGLRHHRRLRAGARRLAGGVTVSRFGLKRACCRWCSSCTCRIWCSSIWPRLPAI